MAQEKINRYEIVKVSQNDKVNVPVFCVWDKEDGSMTLLSGNTNKWPYDYNSKLTHKPRTMKSANPTKSVLNQTKNNHSVSKTFSQELKNQLTKEIPKCSKPQVAINGQGPSKIINEACLNLAYLMELDALRSCFNGIFENLTGSQNSTNLQLLDLVTSSHKLAKVRSEINERMKKLDNFNKQFSDEPVVTSVTSQEPTPMELEGKDSDIIVIEPVQDNKINKTEKNTAILPKNDSKWTLRYRKKAEGLVELEEGSGVYVSERGLEDCKSISKSSKYFARRLLVEVYSDLALRKCSLTGTKARPGLDSYARRVLLRAVQKHAREQNWEKLETVSEITMHRQCIEQTLGNKLKYLRSQYSKHIK